MLGVLQGATELFPISSLGHTVLFPNLFGWDNIVAWQSQPESPWLAFVVMLHVGSAVGLLIYFWKDWMAIVKAFFATLSQAADRDAHRAPGLADHLRHDPGRDPRAAARAPGPRGAGQAAVRGDLPHGQRPDPARRRALTQALRGARAGRPRGAEDRRRSAARHAGVPRGGRDRRRSVLGPDRRHQPRRRVHERGTGPRPRQLRRGALRLPARHAADPRRRPLQAPRPDRAPRQRRPRRGGHRGDRAPPSPRSSPSTTSPATSRRAT